MPAMLSGGICALALMPIGDELTPLTAAKRKRTISLHLRMPKFPFTQARALEASEKRDKVDRK